MAGHRIKVTCQLRELVRAMDRRPHGEISLTNPTSRLTEFRQGAQQPPGERYRREETKQEYPKGGDNRKRVEPFCRTADVVTLAHHRILVHGPDGLSGRLELLEGGFEFGEIEVPRLLGVFDLHELIEFVLITHPQHPQSLGDL